MTFTRDGKTLIEDLGSINGIVVNGTRQNAATLAIGDRVGFGLIEYSSTGG